MYPGILLTLVIAIVITVNPAFAQATQPPATCGFTQGFAAFRDELGPDIVGACLTDQTFTERGNAIQQTTNGVLEWVADENRTTFLADDRIWFAGTGGLHGPVRINETAPLAGDRPVSAMAVLSHALLGRSDVPPPYQLYRPRLATPHEPAAGRQCVDQNRETLSHTLGGVQAGFLTPEQNRAVTHRLWALQEGHGAAAFQEVLRFYTECPVEGVSTIEQDGHRVERTVSRTVERKGGIGDEAVQVHQETRVTGVSGRYVVDISVVRYGDVVSVVTVSPPNAQLLDELISRVDDKVRGILGAHDTPARTGL